MHKFSHSIVIMLSFLLLNGCSHSADKKGESAFDLVQAKKEIEAANKAFVDLFAKGDSLALSNYFTEDAKSMGPNELSVEGRGKISTVYAGLINAGLNHMNLVTTGVWGNEDMLGEEGIYTFSDKTGKEMDNGKYIVLWKKQDGQWKIFRDCYNSNLPAQAQP